MSVFTEAQVSFTLADYASTDTAGKLNVIGGGITFIGQPPELGGASAPFFVVVTVSVPAKYVNTKYALTLELRDVTEGNFVMIPTDGGQLQPVRAQQAVSVAPIQVGPGLAIPDDALVSNTLIMGFGNGLPLTPGHSYEWRVEIDGQHMKHWWHRFHVLGPAPGPVFGGPTNSPTIPGVGEYVVEAPEEGDPAEDDEPEKS